MPLQSEIIDQVPGHSKHRQDQTSDLAPVGNNYDQKRTHVKQDIVASLAGCTPKDDYAYNAIVNHKYEWPFITYNCMDYISVTKDFELISLQSKNTPISEEVKEANAHIQFLCYVYPGQGVVVNLLYDPSTINDEQAKAILDRAKEISKARAAK